MVGRDRYKVNQWYDVPEKNRRGNNSGQQKVRTRGAITKVFVSNIPERCSSADLVGVLKGFGEIAGSYIARKYDRLGKRFGFVSFMNVKDLLSLEQDLRDVWIGSYKLFIVLARFVDGEKVSWKEEKQWQPVKGKEVQIDKFVENMEPQKKSDHIGTSGGGARSFKDALINKEVEHVVTEVYVDEKVIAFQEWFDRSLIGRVKDFGSLTSLRKMISGLSDCSFTIKYVEGFRVVLVFDNSKEKDEFLEKKEGWSSCFDSLETWRGQVCKDIGSQFGAVAQSGSCDQEDGDFLYVLMGVLVKSPDRINKKINLIWKEDKFSIVVEKESSDCIPDCLVDLEEEINVVDSQEVPKAVGNVEGDRSVGEDENSMEGDDFSEGDQQSTVNKVLNDNESDIHGNIQGIFSNHLKEGTNVATAKFKRVKNSRKHRGSGISKSPVGLERPK
ncbi:putative RNA recognition motif domain, nucleotide-binding alpha-beta plait domain superfamily [Helianthus annuus]|nr:putative RNA recognition motif domain, nucleotide-binding alpha-beta plait domain superfamily [Helianthus annuus]KAJ0768670.1 putative RNA recognition motif domain, nucleotide-binding alpha-beta plait domain superfamily [Helianthus annuus]KAJ0774415.1 putative RNA recognition motif domain, nucleotide-binding alpha-beta plait domain superfamily [Helianthus annuus]